LRRCCKQGILECAGSPASSKALLISLILWERVGERALANQTLADAAAPPNAISPAKEAYALEIVLPRIERLFAGSKISPHRWGEKQFMGDLALGPLLNPFARERGDRLRQYRIAGSFRSNEFY